MDRRISEQLQAARDFETKKRPFETAVERPSFHLTPPVGWMNDPNGFSFFNGEYHLFYQYHPYKTSWGPMHWGHSKTKDFVRWERCPCALAPDMSYDAGGCFSGTAVVRDGEHILMYTSVREEKQPDGTVKMWQTQSIAVGDGTDYVKCEENPVITADMLPAGSSQADFRDPKIWRCNDGYNAVIASRGPDGSGQAALFSSKDVLRWSFEKILDQSADRCGKMWECPDFFSIGDEQVFIVSPQSMQAEGLEFHGGNNSVYFIGSYDDVKKDFQRKNAYSIDYGMDFYAPQTVETQDGRRVMVGWLQSWDNYLTPDISDWSGMMTVPRELRIEGGRLIQNPVRELLSYRINAVSHSVVLNGAADGPAELDGVRGRCFDMTVEVKEGNYDAFIITVAAGDGKRTLLTYEPEESIFTTDRTWCSMTRDLLTRRSMYVRNQRGAVKIRVLMDKYTLEIFINDGEQAMTSLIYTTLDAGGILFESRGEVRFDVTKYDICMN